MSTPPRNQKSAPRLDRLLDELADDVLHMSDADLLSETDAASTAKDISAARDAYERAKVTVGKQKWAAAKAAVVATKVARQATGAQHRNINAIRAHVEALANENAVMREKLTLAARNGQAWSDETVLEIWEELVELGVVPDEPKR